MTEKRYVRILDYSEKEVRIFDEHNQKNIFNIFFEGLDSAICLNGALEDVVELLNGLHKKYIDEYTLRETLSLELQRVEEENKELKAQLYCDDDSVCNICKHQQLIPHKVMQGFYTAKCEKGHKECSKEDLRHCDDFKLKELKE